MYDVITGDLSALRLERNQLWLGPVRVLARETTETAVTEPGNAPIPAPGQAFFYLIQQRREGGASGYGTETAPWPRVPTTCEGGCPPGAGEGIVSGGAAAGPSSSP